MSDIVLPFVDSSQPEWARSPPGSTALPIAYWQTDCNLQWILPYIFGELEETPFAFYGDLLLLETPQHL
jgi:hypothetical protein